MKFPFGVACADVSNYNLMQCYVNSGERVVVMFMAGVRMVTVVVRMVMRFVILVVMIVMHCDYGDA